MIVFVLLCIATLEYDTPQIDICWVIFAFTAKSFLCTCLIVIVSIAKSIKEACQRKRLRSKVTNYTAESISTEPQKPTIVTTTEPDLSFGQEAEWTQKPFEYLRQPKQSARIVEGKKAPTKLAGLR